MQAAIRGGDSEENEEACLTNFKQFLVIYLEFEKSMEDVKSKFIQFLKKDYHPQVDPTLMDLRIKTTKVYDCQ